MPSASSGYTAKPSRASRSAGEATSAKLIVPRSRTAVIHASGAAGVTVRRKPVGDGAAVLAHEEVGRNALRPYTEAGDADGLAPAMRIMIGATPAKLTSSAWSTASAMPAAQPASTALPPASRSANRRPTRGSARWRWRAGCRRGWGAGTRRGMRSSAGEDTAEGDATGGRGRPGGDFRMAGRRRSLQSDVTSRGACPVCSA